MMEKEEAKDYRDSQITQRLLALGMNRRGNQECKDENTRGQKEGME